MGPKFWKCPPVALSLLKFSQDPAHLPSGPTALGWAVWSPFGSTHSSCEPLPFLPDSTPPACTEISVLNHSISGGLPWNLLCPFQGLLLLLEPTEVTGAQCGLFPCLQFQFASILSVLTHLLHQTVYLLQSAFSIFSFPASVGGR